jgi:hypothetical protein
MGVKWRQRPLSPHAATYFWLNGLLDSWRNRKEVTWYGPAPSSLARCIARNLCHDVYFRRDTYRYFWRELLKVWIKVRHDHHLARKFTAVV